MKRLKVGIVDYGMGNLHSVRKAVSLQGGLPFVSDKESVLAKADLLLLPGVGAFGAAARNLDKKKLTAFIRSWCQDGKPYLGICLGFQLLFDGSEEDRGVPGLGIFRGKVVRFRPKNFGSTDFQIPHMGWNEVRPVTPAAKNIFRGIDQKANFYFVHSYFPDPKDNGLVATTTRYGKPFCSSIAKGRLFASQFHPEKSGSVGLKLLKNILQGAHP